ncbi:16346_t:CDS:2 [Funneliformis geosporum]|uniref:5604_t:CDS:1 n=1 Tax=Funneliformis geosporum TaxID=1117311 RepID=A0A9W4SLZ2_9GLOM|nr:16346_t:CDS:2 [Funneliformis geosporum]CAI2171837.1 5604_t:CDS:2 [Funneliformis geosporum]
MNVESPHLVPVYLSFLSEESKVFLGIEIPNYGERQLFDYPSYLRELSWVELCKLISIWWKITKTIRHPNKLRVLEFKNHTFPSFNELSAIICNTGSTLEVLKYEGVERYGNVERYPGMIMNIANHCPNLRKLEVKATGEAIPQLSFLFESCKRLELLKIRGKFDPGGNVDEEYLPRLARIVPENLKNLEIITFYTFSISAVQSFLQNCKASIKELTLRCAGDPEKHLEAFKKYGRNKDLNVKAHTVRQLKWGINDISMYFDRDYELLF